MEGRNGGGSKLDRRNGVRSLRQLQQVHRNGQRRGRQEWQVISCAPLLGVPPSGGIGIVLAAFALDRAPGSNFMSCSISACRVPASSLASALRMGMTTSVSSMAISQSLHHPAFALTVSALVAALVSVPEVHTQGENSPLGCSHNNCVAEPGPGRNTSACLSLLRPRTPTTYAAHLVPLRARSKGHHYLLRHMGTMPVPTASQAFM